MKEAIGGHLRVQLNRVGTFAKVVLRESIETMKQEKPYPLGGTIDVQHGLKPQPKPSEKSQA